MEGAKASQPPTFANFNHRLFVDNLNHDVQASAAAESGLLSFWDWFFLVFER